MSETAVTTQRHLKIQYRGRGGQILIYLGKLLRGFIYQADWKVMPMAALIAGLVSMVVRRDFFLTMEGTLKGAFALTCVSIWNGCFNSIQVVCRERDIIKREHRSGLHISAYIFAHMVYQALLCLLQTGITLFVCQRTGIQFPQQGLFTPWLIVDIGITVFLITYASDMLSLWVSCITRSTTTAMTVMPFILIFQLVFSGGIFTLPQWAIKISAASISNYGLKCIAAQADYNKQPLVTAWNSIVKVEKQEFNTTVTVGQILDFLQKDDVSLIHDFRATEFNTPTTGQLLSMFGLTGDTPLGTGLPSFNELLSMGKGMLPENIADGENTLSSEESTPRTVTFGQVIDELAAMDGVKNIRDKSYDFSATVGQIIEVIGREKMQNYVQDMTAQSNQNVDYENSKENIFRYWANISLFVIVFAILSVICLEFVDKDKR